MHARVNWVISGVPWDVEDQLIDGETHLPLNILVQPFREGAVEIAFVGVINAHQRTWLELNYANPRTVRLGRDRDIEKSKARSYAVFSASYFFLCARHSQIDST
jgi:hypothetical protein